MGKLEGRSAIVSGAGRGIGRSIALKLAEEGASVVVNDLDPGPANEVVAEIVGVGGNAVVCAGNAVEPGFAERFVTTAVDSFGGLDINNNAGYTWDNVIQKMSDDQVLLWEAGEGEQIRGCLLEQRCRVREARLELVDDAAVLFADHGGVAGASVLSPTPPARNYRLASRPLREE